MFSPCHLTPLMLAETSVPVMCNLKYKCFRDLISICVRTHRNRLEEERLGVLPWAVEKLYINRAELSKPHTHPDLEQGIQIHHSRNVSHMSVAHSSQYFAEWLLKIARTDRVKINTSAPIRALSGSKQSYPLTSPIFSWKIRWESSYVDNHGSLSTAHLRLSGRDILNCCTSLLQASQHKAHKCWPSW